MEDKDKYGLLINQNTKLHRQYFREMVKLIGIHVLYRYCLDDKKYNLYADLDANYSEPILVGCVFREHPDQRTLRKIGWVDELQENSSIIEVDYDLPNLQKGCLFIIPGGLDNSEGRVFRVTKLTNSMVYPASIVCEIVPEYTNSFNPTTAYNYEDNNFTLISEEPDDYEYPNDDNIYDPSEE